MQKKNKNTHYTRREEREREKETCEWHGGRGALKRDWFPLVLPFCFLCRTKMPETPALSCTETTGFTTFCFEGISK